MAETSTTKNETSEVRNLKALSPSDPAVKDVLELLGETHIPMNFSRLNSGAGHSISLGRVSDRFHHQMGMSRYDAKFPELKKAIFRLGRKIVPFHFTTVQVNYNYKTKPHIDGHNVGDSVIVGLGGYKGGDLVVSGKRYDIKYRPLMFNGAEHLHSTTAYSGDRYSLVFFRTMEIGWSKPPKTSEESEKD
jgi:hypothetical protein